MELQDGISIPNTGIVLHGSVLLLLADTMAAHQLCGFKVGVGRALRKCRDCNATYDLIQIKVGYIDYNNIIATTASVNCMHKNWIIF